MLGLKLPAIAALSNGHAVTIAGILLVGSIVTLAPVSAQGTGTPTCLPAAAGHNATVGNGTVAPSNDSGGLPGRPCCPPPPTNGSAVSNDTTNATSNGTTSPATNNTTNGTANNTTLPLPPRPPNGTNGTGRPCCPPPPPRGAAAPPPPPPCCPPPPSGVGKGAPATGGTITCAGAGRPPPNANVTSSGNSTNGTAPCPTGANGTDDVSLGTSTVPGLEGAPSVRE